MHALGFECDFESHIHPPLFGLVCLEQSCRIEFSVACLSVKSFPQRSPDPFEAALLSWLVVCHSVGTQLHEIWMQFPIDQRYSSRMHQCLQTPWCCTSLYTFFMFLAFYLFLKLTCAHRSTNIKLPINIFKIRLV